MEIIETIILFTALTSLIVASFAVAANVASYQAVTAESVYARNIMTQLAYGIQGIAEGREASTPIQFSYRLGVFTYNDHFTLAIVLTDPQGETNTTAYSNDHFATLEYASPHVMYGPTPVSDKGTMVADAYTSILGDAVIAHHFSANGTTYVIVKTQPVISSHVNADGTVDVQILIVELVRTSPLLTRQGYLVSAYTSADFVQYSYLSGPVTVSVTYAGHTKSLTVGTPGRAVNVFEKIVQVTIS